MRRRRSRSGSGVFATMMARRGQLAPRLAASCFFLLVCLAMLAEVAVTAERPSNIIKLGAVLPITNNGQLATDKYGDSLSKLAAFILAVRDVNTAYGKTHNVTVKFTVLDSQEHYAQASDATSTLALNGFPNLAAKGYGSPSVHVVIGSDDNHLSQAIGNAAIDYNLMHMAYGADVSAMSRGTLFPNSARVFPSMGYQSAALADFLNYQYKVNRIVVLYTTDIYGQDALNVFNWRSAYYGFHIIDTIQLSPSAVATNETAALLQNAVNHAEELNAYIWVVLSDDLGAVQNFFIQASRILSATTFFVGTSAIATSNLWKHPKITYNYGSTILGGFIGIQQATDDWKHTPKGAQFITNFNTLPATVVYNQSNPSQVLWCSPAVDDAGRPLYRYTVKGKSLCAGTVPNTYRSSNMSDMAGFIYDAVFAAVEAVVYYQKALQPPGTKLRFPSKMDGAAIAASMAVQNVTVVGATGMVGFEAGIGGIPDYGWGDRVQGVRYKVVNYQTNGNCNGQVMQRVGTWTTHDMFIPCAQDPVYLSDPVLYGGCTEINWFTADNHPSPDKPPPVTYVISDGFNTLFTALTIICWVVNFLAVVLLYVFRKKKIVHSSQPPVIALIILGLVYASVRVSLTVAPFPTVKLCTARYWFGHLAFTVVPAFLAKCLRVHLVVNASATKKVKIKTPAVVGFAAALTAVMVVLMIIMTPANKQTLPNNDDYSITGVDTMKFYCKARNWKLDFVLYGYEMLILVATLKVCYDVRSVPDAVKESSHIFRTVMMYVFVGGGAFAVLQALSLDHFIEELIVCVAYFLLVVGTYNYYFWPKFWLLLRGADLDKNFQLVFPGKEGAVGIGAGGTAADAEKSKEDEIKKRFFAKMPKSMEECKILIDVLAAHNMILTQKATGSSDKNSGSNSQSGMSRKDPSQGQVMSQFGRQESVASEAQGAIRDVRVSAMSEGRT